jgi:hypothetical protein
VKFDVFFLHCKLFYPTRGCPIKTLIMLYDVIHVIPFIFDIIRHRSIMLCLFKTGLPTGIIFFVLGEFFTFKRGGRGRGRIVDGFKTTYAIIAYHH